jgi:hypothetical protein
MVNIDTVYQRVLALTNKEQRGYVTPLEFNLLANQAQLDIFEQYFYDISQNEEMPGNDRQYSDIEHILNEKISAFEIEQGNWIPTAVGGGHNLPADLYSIGQIIYTENGKRYICEEVTTKEYMRLQNSPLAGPTNKRPVYIRFRSLGQTSGVESGIRVYGNGGSILNTPISITYIKVPDKVEWGYVVVNEKALYQPSLSNNFEHHPSEETTLVLKILELSGVVINKPGLVTIASQKDMNKTQQEKM